MSESEDPAVNIANAVLDVLHGRKGFDWWWDDIASPDRRNIKLAIAKAVRKKLAALSDAP
jgi:hypothetical protein